eukprot:1240534-Prorocentrum_lima.AAC.1
MRPNDHKLTTAAGRHPFHNAWYTPSSRFGISPTATSVCSNSYVQPKTSCATPVGSLKTCLLYTSDAADDM